MKERFDRAPRSHTIVLEAAAFLITHGLLNVKATTNVNVKQARTLLTFAVWLQHRKSVEWVQSKESAMPPWMGTQGSDARLLLSLVGGACMGENDSFAHDGSTFGLFPWP